MKSKGFTLIELMIAIVVIIILMSLLATEVAKVQRKAKQMRKKIEIEHYMKLLPYIDERPFRVEGNIVYYTNYAFPGILFSVPYEGSERPSL